MTRRWEASDAGGFPRRGRVLQAARARSGITEGVATPWSYRPGVRQRWMGGGTLHRRRRDALQACWPGTLPRLVTLHEA
jgi:hypothetical protein